VENHPKPTGVASGNILSPLGAFDGVVETPRNGMPLTTGIPMECCRRVDLGHAGHQAIDSWRWAGREQMTNESNPEHSEKSGRKVVRWETPRSSNPSSASLANHGKEHEMEGRTDRIEGVLRRIEEHIERWRAEKQAREQDVEADRDALWAEAVEREELLAETIEGEESRGRSAGEICQEQKAVFVVHSRETREALQGLSEESVRLVRMVSAEGASARSVGLEGSWLIFE
jgi:hypothetical protein